MKSCLVVSIGVKSLNEKGDILATSQSPMALPVLDISTPNWEKNLSVAIAATLPSLVQQALSPIAPFDPKVRACTADLLEAMARRLRAEQHGNPKIGVRTDKDFEEIRILIERPKG